MEKVKLLAIGAHRALKEVKSKLKKYYEVDLTTVAYSDVEIFIESGKTKILCKGEKIEDTDFVWIKPNWDTRDLVSTVATYLKRKKIPHTEVEQEKSKLIDILHLAFEGLSVPKTYYCRTNKLVKNIKKIERFCGYPFIIKITKGSLGNGLFYIGDKASFLEQIVRLDSQKHYICQSFIPNEFDYRIIVANLDVVSGEKRIRKGGEFRNNAHLGAEEIFLDLEDIPSDIRELSIKAAKTVNLDWTGIDIVTSTENGKHYILELNRRPGLTSGSSETNAAYEYIIHLLTDKGLLADI